MKIIKFDLVSALRLDKYLVTIFPDLTRSHLQKLIKAGNILVNKKKASSNFILKTGNKISINFPAPRKISTKAANIALNIVYEDKNILVVNKPAGLIVHPTTPDSKLQNTLVNAVLYHCKDLGGIGGKLRPGIVHRLDKDTSGLLVVAKNDQAHQYLSDQIKNREFKKIYWALIKGNITPNQGEINAPLARHISDRKKMAVSANKTAKNALTRYQVLKRFKDCCLVQIQIITGRTHQIRAHFKAIGFPIIGDQSYGDKKINQQFEKMGLKRQFLHAKILGLKLPNNNKFKEFKTPLPKDLDNILKSLQ